MTYLKWQDYLAWKACAGRPALEESEGEVPDAVPVLSKSQRSDLEARKTALEGASAVEILPLQSLPVGAITGERGAVAWASLILAEYTDHSALEVYPPDKILALAALVKHSILQKITATNVGSPDELFASAGEITEAAQLSLNLRASITALEHLVPGEYCRTCRAAYRCPALTKEVHAEVFGPLEALEDAEARPTPVPTSVGPQSEWGVHVLPKLPVIEGWVAAVKRAAGIQAPTNSAPPQKRRRRKKSRHRQRPQKPNHGAERPQE